jgi:hypothetical protein
MSETISAPALIETPAVASASRGLFGWVATVDHKRIGILYLLTTLVFFAAGGVEALLIRIQLARPNNHFLSPDAFDQIFTMDPVRFLVVQRLLASLLLTPLLTIYSMFTGVLGGVLVMLALGFNMTTILAQLESSVHIKDIVFGTSKGFVFGIIVAGIACLRGLHTKSGPSAVGQATTRSVVSGILLIVIADAGFANLWFILNK